MDGVHSIFDDVNIWIENLIKFTSENQKFLYLVLLTQSRMMFWLESKSNSKNFETGFNRISLDTIIKGFKKKL